MPLDPELAWKIWQTVAKVIVDLELPEIGDHVYLQMVLDPTAGYSVAQNQTVDVVYPCVFVSLDTEAEERGPDDNETKSWRWPARLWIADHHAVKLHHRMPIYLRARKALLDTFDDKRLVDVPEVVRMTVLPGVQFDPRAPAYQYLVSGMTLRVETEEKR